MHRGCFGVDAVTSPCGSEDATPRSRACVRLLVCPDQVGQAGLPSAFWCPSPSPLAALSFCFARPPPGCSCPFCGSLVASPPPFFFPAVPFSARPPPCVLVSFVSGPGRLGPCCLVFLFSPPPRLVFFFYRRAPPLSLAFCGFRPLVPLALALFAVCFVGLQLLGSPCALASFVVPAWPLAAPWWLSTPHFFCVSLFFSLPLCALFFLSRCAPPFSLAFSGFRPRLPWALALCAVCFVGLPLLGSPCALASFVVPAWSVAAPWCLLTPPPLSCLAVFLAAALCSVFSFLVARPRCLWLSLVSSPGCPGPWRCVLFVLFASRSSSLRGLSPLLWLPPGR